MAVCITALWPKDATAATRSGLLCQRPPEATFTVCARKDPVDTVAACRRDQPGRTPCPAGSSSTTPPRPLPPF